MRFRKTKKTIAAAVRIEVPLYEYAMRIADMQDSNFSRYVRGLIRRDLQEQKPLLSSSRPEVAR